MMRSCAVVGLTQHRTHGPPPPPPRARARSELAAVVTIVVVMGVSLCAEPEAVDLLLEVDQLDQLEQYVDDKNFARTCLYLTSCCNYLPEPEDTQVHSGLSVVVTAVLVSGPAVACAAVVHVVLQRVTVCWIQPLPLQLVVCNLFFSVAYACEVTSDQ